MFRSRQLRFLFGVILAVALLVVAIILIFIHGPSTPTSPSHPKTPAAPMASYANDPTAQVAMLIDGPTSAPSLHNQVLITITNSVTKMLIFQGYNDQVKASYAFPMTDAAFHVFLRSLEYAGYNSGSNNPALSQASGYCPTGDRYIFTFDADGVQKQRYWATNCGGPGTYEGNLDLTIQLFEAQVPNYSNLTGNLNI